MALPSLNGVLRGALSHWVCVPVLILAGHVLRRSDLLGVPGPDLGSAGLEEGGVQAWILAPWAPESTANAIWSALAAGAFLREASCTLGRGRVLVLLGAGTVLAGPLLFGVEAVVLRSGDAWRHSGPATPLWAVFGALALRSSRSVRCFGAWLPVPALLLGAAVLETALATSGSLQASIDPARDLTALSAGLLLGALGALRLRQRSGAPDPPRPRTARVEPDRAELDRILGKIASQGMASLTPGERAALDAAARALQRGRRG
jgi:hypothetical protein